MPKGGGSGIIRIFIKGTPGYNKMQKNIVWTLVQGIVKIWGLATGLFDLLVTSRDRCSRTKPHKKGGRWGH